MKPTPYLSVLVLSLFFLGACTNQARKVYEESTYGPALEVPPDLTAPATDPQFAIPAIGGGSAPAPKRSDETVPKSMPDLSAIEIQRDGALRWLVMKGEPRQLWPWVRDFFLDEGFALDREDARFGIVETAWKQQRVEMPPDRTEVTLDDELLRVFAVPLREKYRARLETGASANTTEIYLTHLGAELLKDDDMVIWRLRGNEPEMEVEMLKRLMIYLGVASEKAGGLLAEASRLNLASIKESKEGEVLLRVEQDFQRVWRRVGVALERLNFIINDRDRGNGTYFVQQTDPLAPTDEENGWFGSLFDSRPEGKSYEIVLRDEGESVDVVVRDEDQKNITGEEAKNLLNQIAGYLE